MGPPDFAIRFTAEGLQAGDKVVWIEAEATAGRARQWLDDAGIDVERRLTDGALVLWTVTGSLLRGGEDGAGAAEAALATVRDELRRSEREGFHALRLVQELSDTRSAGFEPDALRAYEAGLDDLVERFPLRAICLYDLHRSSGEDSSADTDEHPSVVESSSMALAEHANIVEEGEPVDNLFFAPRDNGRSRAAVGRQRVALLDRYREGREAMRRHEALVHLLGSLHGADAGTEDTTHAIESVLEEICIYMGWRVGHAYVLDRETGLLDPLPIWHGEEPSGAFARETDLRPLRSGECVPGRALSTGKIAWVSDAWRDPDFKRLDAAKLAGLRTVVAVPIRVEGAVSGVLEFLTSGRHEPDPHALMVLDYVARALGRILQVRRVEGELDRSERRFRALVDSAPDAIILANEDGRILSWNPAAAQLFGFTQSEILGRPFTALMPDRHRTALQRAVAAEGSSFTSGTFELEGLTKDGRVFPAELALTTWKAGERYFSGIVRETSARKATEEELRLLGSAVANVRDAIVVTTAGSAGQAPTILYVNGAFSKMTGYAETEVLGRSFGVLTGPKTDLDAMRDVYQKLRRGLAGATEITAYHRDGTEFLLEWSASPIREDDGSVRHFVSIQRDITKERVAEQALRRVDRDPLTSLPNREVFVKRLLRSIERTADRPGYRYAVLFLDLDGFKQVNDEHGHLAGDRLLTSAARRLEHTVRPGDTVARFGGDEFVVLLEYVSGISDVIMVADRIQERLRVPFVIGDHHLRVRASMGIALSESGYLDPEDVIRDADAAMYDAKRKGKDRAEFFDGELYVDIVTVVNLQEDLKHSLERREMRVHYQPLVDLGTGGIIGFEALVRWLHPERGLVRPEHFISLAEQSGFIIPIGAWVLRESCLAAAQWQATQESGEPLTLSVNLSIRELTNPGLVDSVRAILDESGLDPARLQLELTESVFAETLEPIRSQLATLRDLGIKVCIDDFGTGYSSLAYLHSFPVDKLKIDRLFVQHMEEAPGNAEIIRTILTLASNLSLDVVAEGVETSDQLARLRDMSCRYGQGFLFSAAVRSDEVEGLLATHNAGSWH